MELLLAAGARPNMGDKYGTTALVWAARKGDSESVKALLNAGAMPDQAGMYSWTALLQATQGIHIMCIMYTFYTFKNNFKIHLSNFFRKSYRYCTNAIRTQTQCKCSG